MNAVYSCSMDSELETLGILVWWVFTGRGRSVCVGFGLVCFSPSTS